MKPDGSFSLNMKYFSYTYGLKMTNAKFDSLFHAQRSPESKLEQIHMDIAASLQVVTEEIMIALARTTAKLSGSRNLVLSGGVALNCVGNGKIYQKLIKEEKILDHIWIQPASGDAGSAVGCGLAFYHIECKQPRLRDSASGEQCGSVADFVKGTTAKVANLPQNPQSSHSPTANLRIREEENQASLSSRADEVGVAIHKSARVDSSTAQNLSEPAQDSRICDEKCGLQGKSQGSYLSGSDRRDFSQLPHLSRKAESTSQKPTPLLQDSMQGSYLGLSYSNDEVQATLDSLKAIYEKHSFDTIKHLTAKALSEGKVIGWHQGRCEFGPRALGARSILGDPRNTTMQKTMNLKIKYRESFRPFAPSVLDFAINEWFECDYISPYMLLVAPVKREKCYPLTKEQKELFGIDKLNIVRSEIPSVTHIDYSARIQSVHKETNPRYYALIEEFYKLSGVPVLVNTSFNVRGEPMVCSPYDSYACFMGTEMDLLVIEDFILYKENQPKEHIARFKDIKDKYELD